MNKVKISNGDVDESLVRGDAKALDNPGSDHAVIVSPDGAGPGARDYDDDEAENEGVALAPDAGRGHKDDTHEADAEQEVARQQGDLCEVEAEP